MAGWVSQAVWAGVEKRKCLRPPAFEFRIVYHVASLCSRADELNGTRTQNGTRKDFFGTRLSLLPHFFLFVLPHQRLSIVKNSWLRTDCIWITVATKQNCSEIFLKNLERCEELTGYLSSGRRPGDDWANKWHLTKHFTVFFSNTKQ
jgi:hypothetical protein